MSTLYINIRNVRDCNYRLPAVRVILENTKSLVRRLGLRIDRRITGRRDISHRIRQTCADMDRLEERLGELYRVTASCADQYEQVEWKNSRNAEEFL